MRATRCVINKFRAICRNEHNISNQDVLFKLTRDFLLGNTVATRKNGNIVKAYGNFAMLAKGDLIVDIWRYKKDKSRVDSDAKRSYNLTHGRVK